MFINVLQDIVLLLFITTVFFALFKDRNVKLGVIVSENGKNLTSGKHGLETTIGRASSCDVRLKEKVVSRVHAIARYNPHIDNFEILEYGTRKGNQSNGYFISGHQLKFSIPVNETCFEYNLLLLTIVETFIILQSLSTINQFVKFSPIIPYMLLIVFLLVSYFTRADEMPIIESIFSILLTFYIDAVMYPATANPEKYSECLRSAILGIAIYVLFNVGMKFFMKIDLEKTKLHNLFRSIGCLAIVALIVLNLALAKNINGAYNWINLGPISFQPSEIVKVLLAFIVIVPINKIFTDKKNLIIQIGMPVLCFVYAILIKDIGVLLQFGALFAVAILIQNTNILYSVLMILSGIAGCKLVLNISSTAACRFYKWAGSENKILESLTGKEVFLKASEYGYQSVHSLVASFANSGLAGNNSFDVMKNVPAANSDLVMSIIAQKHGYPVILLILALYILLIVACVFNSRQQYKFQQTFSVLAITLITFAMMLNMLGTFGILPLTGIVNPCLSDGISSAISYGCLFGVMSSTSMTYRYLNMIKRKV